jgi:hypothetical protein
MPPFSDKDLRDLRQLLQEAALQAYPNPKREGCPGTAVLDAVARTPAPFKHPAYEHVKRCSPCLKEMLDLRQQDLSAKKTSSRRKRKMAYAAIAAAALLATGLWTLRLREKQQTPQLTSTKQEIKNTTTASSQIQAKTPTLWAINFSGISRTRGSGPDAETPPSRVPAGLLTLKITLPFGSDDGQYDIEIRKSGTDRPIAKSSGAARILRGDTQLNINGLDLSQIPHGPYNLFFKHADASWQHGPILID